MSIVARMHYLGSRRMTILLAALFDPVDTAFTLVKATKLLLS